MPVNGMRLRLLAFDNGHMQRPRRSTGRGAETLRTVPRPLFPIRLRYIHPSNRKWLVGSILQLLRQFVQPSFYSIRFDVIERLAVDSCRSAIALQQSEANARTSLRYTLSYRA